jgi:acyl-coenzyme A thioesterase PaaI-like protein
LEAAACRTSFGGYRQTILSKVWSTKTAKGIHTAANGGFKPCTTVDLTTSYMRPITKADALLEAKVVRLGKALAFCACDVREAGGDKPAAFSTGTYFILG